MRCNTPPLRHLHLRETRAAAPAPWHNVMPAVNESFGVALFQKRPDGVIVLVGKGEVAAAVLSRSEFPHDFTGSRGFCVTARQVCSHHAVAIGQRIAQSD